MEEGPERVRHQPEASLRAVGESGLVTILDNTRRGVVPVFASNFGGMANVDNEDNLYRSMANR